jgi:hypothetical protein
MYLSTLGRIALRRWPLVILALLTTAAGLFAVSTSVQPEYRDSASVVLIPPKSLEEPDSNRYLSLGSLDQAVGVLVRTLTSDEVKRQVTAVAPVGNYEILADWTTSAPIIVVTSTAHSKADADALLSATLAQIPSQLDQLQTSIGVLDTQRISSLPLTRDATPSRVLKPLLRALIAAAVALLALSVGLIAVVDGLVLRRRRPRVMVAAADAGPPPDPADEIEEMKPETAETVETVDEEEAEQEDEQEPAAEEKGEEPVREEPVREEPDPVLAGVRSSEHQNRRDRRRERSRRGIRTDPDVSPLRKPEPAIPRLGWSEDDDEKGVPDRRTRAVS